MYKMGILNNIFKLQHFFTVTIIFVFQWLQLLPESGGWVRGHCGSGTSSWISCSYGSPHRANDASESPRKASPSRVSNATTTPLWPAPTISWSQYKPADEYAEASVPTRRSDATEHVILLIFWPEPSGFIKQLLSKPGRRSAGRSVII